MSDHAARRTPHAAPPIAAPPIAAILIDLDGTIVDSEPCHFEAHKRFLPTVGIAVTQADVEGNVGRGDRAFYRALMERHGVGGDAQEWVQRKTQVLMDIYRQDGLALRPGALDLLKRAEKAGIFTYVVTSSSRPLVALSLEVNGLARRLPARVCHEDVDRHKPDPAPYLLAAARLGVPIGRCLVIEDSVTGARSGVASGARTIGFTGWASRADLLAAGVHQVVDHLDEVVL